MLGQPPRSMHFQQQFDWPDAVLPMPFDAPHIGELIAELEREPQRLAHISRDSVYNAARRHDWVYRVRAVFEQLGLPVTEGILARESKLAALASGIRARPWEQLASPLEMR